MLKGLANQTTQICSRLVVHNLDRLSLVVLGQIHQRNIVEDGQKGQRPIGIFDLERQHDTAHLTNEGEQFIDSNAQVFLPEVQEKTPGIGIRRRPTGLPERAKSRCPVHAPVPPSGRTRHAPAPWRIRYRYRRLHRRRSSSRWSCRAA